MRTNRTLLTVWLTLLPFAAAAQVYSWKDSSGKIHYGDRPPAEREAQVRRLPAAPTSSDEEATRKAMAERKFAEREKQAAQTPKPPPEDPAQAKIREENCQRAKNTLAGLESGQLRFTLNEKGERVALDGAVRDAELARARKAVDDWCTPPAAK